VVERWLPNGHRAPSCATRTARVGGRLAVDGTSGTASRGMEADAAGAANAAGPPAMRTFTRHGKDERRGSPSPSRAFSAGPLVPGARIPATGRTRTIPACRPAVRSNGSETASRRGTRRSVRQGDDGDPAARMEGRSVHGRMGAGSCTPADAISTRFAGLPANGGDADRPARRTPFADLGAQPPSRSAACTASRSCSAVKGLGRKRAPGSSTPSRCTASSA